MRKTKSDMFMLIALLSLVSLLLAACGNTAQTPVTTEAPAEAEEHEDSMEGEVSSEGDHDEAGETGTDEGEHAEDTDEADHAEEGKEADHGHDEESDEGDHAHADVPHEYEDLTNPFADLEEAIATGGELFAVNCASCHGETGMGDGAAAASLDPKPASLADSDMMADLTDGYLVWRITEGGIGEPFNSAMVAWGDTFSEEQIWQLVSFVRSLSQ
jgi:mono/diheme cytochrome c family protein